MDINLAEAYDFRRRQFGQKFLLILSVSSPKDIKNSLHQFISIYASKTIWHLKLLMNIPDCENVIVRVIFLTTTYTQNSQQWVCKNDKPWLKGDCFNRDQCHKSVHCTFHNYLTTNLQNCSNPINFHVPSDIQICVWNFDQDPLYHLFPTIMHGYLYMEVSQIIQPGSRYTWAVVLICQDYFDFLD